MQKVAIITDSQACLARELVEKYRIGIVPYNLTFEGKVYKDWVDITPSEAYKLFLKNPDAFGATAASAGDYLEVYREVSKQAQSVLCVTQSSGLGTAYNMARVAKEQAEVELPQLSIEVLDSQTTAVAQGLIALAVARAAAQGESLGEVVKVGEGMRDRVSLITFLDTMRYVYRSGRIPRVAARAGSLLNIKPMFTISSGVVHLIGIVRTKEQGIDRILRILRGKAGLSPVHVAVMHAYALDEAKKLIGRISSEFNCAEIWLTECSPVIGYACGTGTLGVAFYPESKRNLELHE